MTGSEGIDHAWTTIHIIDSVKKAGFLPFGNLMSDSHRAFFLDFDEQMIHKSIHDFIQWNLHSMHQIKAPNFIKIILDGFDKANIHERFEALNEEVFNEKR